MELVFEYFRVRVVLLRMSKRLEIDCDFLRNEERVEVCGFSRFALEHYVPG